MRSSILPAALALGALGLSARADAPRINFEKYTLPNGLEVILSADHRVPVVHVQVFYHVGSKDEEAGKTGFAHLFEHMMFQGSRDLAEDTWFKKLDAVGGYGINGTTNTERTNYFESVPSNQLELVLWMESDRMGFLLDHVNEDSFKNQQEVVRNERRQRMEMAPYGMAHKFRLEALYPPAHPYHHTVIGEHEDLARASVEDVKAFFRRYYVPRDATLCIAGDFDPAKTRELVQKYFGSLPAAPAPPRKPAGPPAAPVQRLVAMEANVQLARLEYVWHGPVAWAADEPPIDLLAEVLTDGKTSRLHKRLVYELRIAQSVSASSANNEYGGQFDITVMVKPGHTLAEVRKVVDEELARILEKPVGAEELARVKTKWEARFIRSLETNQGRASQLQVANHFTRDPDKANQDLPRHLQVTPQAIQAAARKWLQPDKKLVLTVVPNKEAPISGQLIEKLTEKN
ncbi:MAG TPA: pitrilysin family protein [Polyangia bacterium]|nr:pitrilysin family protein [Polyangia bacterium]